MLKLNFFLVISLKYKDNLFAKLIIEISLKNYNKKKHLNEVKKCYINKLFAKT
jgi:hypothetical protein